MRGSEVDVGDGYQSSFAVAGQHAPDATINEADETAAAVATQRRRAHFAAAAGEAAAPGTSAEVVAPVQGFTTLATAVVRVAHELRVLQEKPVDGVEVSSESALVWKVIVRGEGLSHPHELELDFPAHYPHEPPVAKLRDLEGRPLPGTEDSPHPEATVPLKANASWSADSGVRGILMELREALSSGTTQCSNSTSSGGTLLSTEEIKTVAKATFAVVDEDGDGLVDAAEGARAMANIYGIAEAEARAIWHRRLKDNDQNADGKLSAGEWLGFVRNAANMGKFEDLRKMAAQ